ncbi:helix-turn-helix transcriptional regulator [Acetobacterium bakii]|uniref:Transcriptional regulator n=1 Tax=Acetobacterium bakii TaxID=52689 RepID=A0A0L6U1T4_9FIRM|nr:helix-turn-helix transcriptional regulator [Acetobacterium bakii]KNZ42469.1 hypothetical protein AKG39_05950 [Acetobacterium bakii]
MNKKLEAYITLVDFLADFMGENTEVVLHDLTDWHHSVIAIRNGHISGRKVGAPITEVSLKILRSEIHKKAPYMENKKKTSKKGVAMHSATWFIKDDHEFLLGMLCINSDCHELIVARDILNKMIRIPEIQDQSKAVLPETVNLDAKALVDDHVSHILSESGQNIFNLNKDEKVELVGKLQALGTFSVKGTIWYLADTMGVSLPTVYRYITLAKKEK